VRGKREQASACCLRACKLAVIAASRLHRQMDSLRASLKFGTAVPPPQLSPCPIVPNSSHRCSAPTCMSRRSLGAPPSCNIARPTFVHASLGSAMCWYFVSSAAWKRRHNVGAQCPPTGPSLQHPLQMPLPGRLGTKPCSIYSSDWQKECGLNCESSSGSSRLPTTGLQSDGCKQRASCSET
jgi:hypothetical protein